MALFLASALAALLLPVAPARAQDSRELLRPLAVDLRRLYPDLADRWDAADAGRFSRTGQGFHPVEGFLARPDSPRVSLPPRASGVASLERDGLRVKQRLLDAAPAPGVAEGGLLRYRGAFANAEALYLADGLTPRPLFLLTKPGAPTRIASAISVRGGRLKKESDGGLSVVDARGARALRLAAPVVLDARGRRRSAEWTLRGGPKGDYTVVLSFDASGLAYPLLVR